MTRNAIIKIETGICGIDIAAMIARVGVGARFLVENGSCAVKQLDNIDAVSILVSVDLNHMNEGTV